MSRLHSVPAAVGVTLAAASAAADGAVPGLVAEKVARW